MNFTTTNEVVTMSPSPASSALIEETSAAAENDATDEISSSLTEAQDKALSLTPLFSGLLSAWGSANIIYMVYTRRNRSKARRKIGNEDNEEEDVESVASASAGGGRTGITHGCYERIMLGLSVFDMISSLAIAFQPFVLPSDTSDRIWASGTDGTCTAMGFFQQLSLANIWYTGFLSVFFLLTIRYSISERYLAKCIEPMFHVIAIGYAVVTATAGVLLGAYGEMDIGHYCYLKSDYPEGCQHCDNGNDDETSLSLDEEDEGVVCCQRTMLMYIFAAIPNLLVLMAVILSNLLIYCYMRGVIRKERNDNKIISQDDDNDLPPMNAGAGQGELASSSKPEQYPGITIEDNDNAKKIRMGKKGGGDACTVATSSASTLPTVASSYVSVATTTAASSSVMMGASMATTSTLASAEISTTTASTEEKKKEYPKHHYHHYNMSTTTPTAALNNNNNNNNNNRGNNSNGSSVISNVARIQQEQKRAQQLQLQSLARQQERQTKRLQAVANQAFLYVGGFLVTQLPVILMGIMATGKDYNAQDDAGMFPILWLRSLLWPLQGLFNYCIYIRPSYLREM